MRYSTLLVIFFVLLFATSSIPAVSAASINSTDAEGIAAYAENGVVTPRYQLWNVTQNNFTGERTNTVTVGNTMTWVVTKASHERDEMIMVTEDSGSTIDAQILNATQNWTNVQVISPDIANTAQRAFDVAYMDVSGNALLAYENSGAAGNNVIGFVLWNGTNFTAERNYSTTMANSAVRWVSLYPKPGTDQIMALFHNGANDLNAVLWNGTDFNVSTSANLTLTSTGSTIPHFDFAWESTSGDGLVAYGVGTTWERRNYTASSGTWSAAESEDMGQGVDALRLCADINSNYIGIILEDAGNDVNVRVWNGSRILAGSPTQDATTEPAGANNVNGDCAWNTNGGNLALFGFVDFNGLNMSYVTFTRANESWSTSTLLSPQYTTNFASDGSEEIGIKSLRFMEHPTTNETMILALDLAEDLTVAKWNGTAVNSSIVASPLETSTDVLNGDQEVAFFDWSRFDPQPTVLNLTLNWSFINETQSVNFTVNVTDNIAVDIVSVNVTKPSGAVVQANLTRVGSIYNLTFADTDQTGRYTIRVIANDTSRHQNYNDTQTITLGVGDVTNPLVVNLTANDTSIEVNEIINITANVTDDRRVGVVLINITIPGVSGFDQYVMTNVSNALPSIFNLTFANTSKTGNYTVRIIANDTSNNTNSTEIITIAVGDVTNPTVVNLSVNQSVIDQSGSINISVNVTDNNRVDTVLVNITVPGVSGFDQYRMTNISNALSSIFNLTFTNTSRKGIYHVRIITNDTSGNINSTEIINFSSGDNINPTVTQNSPANLSNFSTQSVSFSFTSVDDRSATTDCNLTVDSSVNATNSGVANNTATTIDGSGYAQGNHTWSVQCTDGAGNQGNTTSRTLTVDITPPDFNSLTFIPSSSDAIDPGIRIAFYANVSDNVTLPNTITLQQKLINVSDFTDINMTLNASNGLYEAAFTPTVNGTYNIRVTANDTVNNRGQSAVTNITVELDRTWTRIPVSAAVGTLQGQAINLINLTLNNTGDFALNFTVTSTFANTRFNTTFPVQLASNETRIVEINVTAPTTIGSTVIVLETNATANANPVSQNTTVTLAVTEGSAFLAATFTSTPTNITKGQTVTITGQIENIGTANATNASLFFTIPTDWTLIGGALNNTFGELLMNDPASRSITVNVPSNASDGIQTIRINASGLNESNTDLVPLNLISGETRTIGIQNVTVIGAGPVAAPAAVTGAVVSAPIPEAAAVPTRVGGIAGKLTPSLEKKLVETYETIYVVRGENMTFPLNITNVYNDTLLDDVTLAIDGYLAQYLFWEPKILDILHFAETKQFIVTVAAPGYKEREEHILTATITGTLSANLTTITYNKKTKQNETTTTVEKIKIIETRHVTLIILETSVLEAAENQKQAEEYLNEFRERGIGTTTLEALVTALNTAYASEQFAEVETISQEIEVFAAMVLETDEILKEVRERYETLQEQGYDVEEWNGLITLAEMAFAEENFESAYLRAKEAQLYQAIAVEQQFNLSAFFLEYWQEIVISILIALGVGYFTERRIFLLTVGKQLMQLDAKEEQTEILKEEAQRECFTFRKISTLTYHKRMYQYELLLDTIRKKRYELQKKKERLLTGEEMLLFLRRDNARVLEKIKEMQEAYYNKASIPKSEYMQKSSLYKNQLAQNEKESAVIEARVQQEIMLKEQLRKEISENIHLFNNHQMKKPPMQNIEEIIANISSYAYLVSKGAIKWSLFSAKEMYDLLLLRMMDMHKTMGTKEREKQKEVQEDLTVAKELLEMVHAEKKQYPKDRIHPWHLREIAEKGKHAVHAASITLSWLWKKKKTEVSQYMQKNYMQKQWSWRGACQYLSYKSYFLFEEWKWRCKELLLQVRT